MCGIKNIMDKTNYQAGLKVTSNAYDAVNGVNELTSSEYFDFNEVGIYDTQTNTWLDLSEEQLNDPEVIKRYSDDSRYAMALGSDMDNIDGFMNISDFIKERGLSDGLGNAKNERNLNNPNVDSVIGRYTDTGTGNKTYSSESTQDGSKSGSRIDVEAIKWFRENGMQNDEIDVVALEKEVKNNVMPQLGNILGDSNIKTVFNGQEATVDANYMTRVLTIHTFENGHSVDYNFNVDDGLFISKK